MPGSERVAREGIGGQRVVDFSRVALGPALIALARTEGSLPETRDRGIARLKDLMYLDPIVSVALNLPLAQALEAEGRWTEAAGAYSRFIAFWEEADPELQPRVTGARQALEQLREEGSGT